MHPLTMDFSEQILALIRVHSYSLLGAIQDNKTVLGGSGGSGGGVGDPPAGFVGQLTQSNVTFDTGGPTRACSAGSSGSSSLVDNLDAIRLGTEICDDAIGDRHIDWGHGAGQVDAEDVPFTSGSLVSTNVHDALEELLGQGGIKTIGQVISVGVSGCNFTLPSLAVAYINGLGDAAANKPYLIWMMAGEFVEAAAVTIPSHVDLVGQGEATILDMTDDTLTVSADASLRRIIVTSTADNAPFRTVKVAGNNAVVDNVRVICTNWNTALSIESADDVRLYNVTVETDTQQCVGFYLNGSTVEMWDCHADDSTNFWPAMNVGLSGTPSTVTTRYCTFHGAAGDDDVDLKANCTWNHFCTQFDPDNCTLTGTEVPLMHGKTNFDDVVTFEDGFTMDGASGANIVTIPGAQAIGFTLVDDAAVEYLRIKTVAQLETHFNDAGADIDFIVEASVADALVVRGSDSQITLGILGAGLIETTAGGVLSSDYTINSTVTMASGQDMDPADASGQDLGDATHRWDLYTQNVFFGGASGANIVTVPDNVADAWHLSDAGGLEYMRVVSTDANPGLWIPRHLAIGSAASVALYSSIQVVENIPCGAANTVTGMSVDITTQPTANRAAGDFAQFFMLYTDPATAWNYMGIYGLFGGCRHSGTGVVADAFAAAYGVQLTDDGGSITASYGMAIRTPARLSGDKTIGTNYGLYLYDQNPAFVTTPYAIYSVGETSPSWHYGPFSIGGTIGALAQLHVDNPSAARPVAYFDQGDISEEMFEFATTIGVGNAIEAVGGKTLTTTHFIKVTLPGALTRYFPVGTIA